MSRTQFEFGPTQINKSTPDSDAVLFGRSHSRPQSLRSFGHVVGETEDRQRHFTRFAQNQAHVSGSN